MDENKIIYRPPVESGSLLLEISDGCSWGKCSFCRCSSDSVQFCLSPYEQIIKDLQTIRESGTDNNRIFLTGGNVFAFKTEFLLELFALVRSYLPFVTEFSMYARADDILNKSREQLTELKQNGLSTLYVGVESGSDRILSRCNKGIDTARMLRAFNTLDTYGIPYGISIIIGLGGRNTAEEAARATADFLNRLRPESIRVMRLTPIEGTILAEQIESGEFTCQDGAESLREEFMLLSMLRVQSAECVFVANHVSNEHPMVGILPYDREKMLSELRDEISRNTGGSLVDNNYRGRW